MYPILLGAKENTKLVNSVDLALKKFLDLLGGSGNTISNN